MAFCLRLMSRGDVPQVTAIDREAFPTQLPPPDYYHELQNKLARYIVIDKDCDETAEEIVVPEEKRGIRGLALRLKQALNPDNQIEESGETPGYIIGFAGFWIMADEAHITSIAVREKYRGRGLGELLLLYLIELARELKATLITLEVRASNTVAQALYTKYDFVKVGVRRGYYTDNDEDGVLMTLENISSDAVLSNLEQLKQAHTQKWGKEIAVSQISRD